MIYALFFPDCRSPILHLTAKFAKVYAMNASYTLRTLRKNFANFAVKLCSKQQTSNI